MQRCSRIALGLSEQARRFPDRITVRDATGEVTAAELDALVGTLARHLLEVRTGHPTTGPVPVLVGRNRWSVVALLAAFRAGVPCTPIDATLPAGVIADLLDRIGRPPVAVLPDAALDGGLPPEIGAIIVPRTPDDPVGPTPVDLDAPGVVLFTSGSTGRPKGVVLDWAAFESTSAHHLATNAPDESAARIGLLAPLQWIGGLRRALAVAEGAAVSILDVREHPDPARLLAWLEAERVTQFGIGPAQTVLLDGVWPAGRRLERVDQIVLGGDTLTGAHVATLQRLCRPDGVIRCTYSASEAAGASVVSQTYRADDLVDPGILPLGSDPSSGRVRFEPVDPADPDGPREIVVLGTVARGYLDDPALTDTRFGTDSDGTRWWRTGDLARVDPDGTVWHAGRLDDTVKINGKLVSPTEAETVLRRFAGVREVAVVPRRGSQRTQLVAHLAVDPAAGLTPTAVRTHCRERLAPHVVPGVLVRHDRLPTTVNGKTDRHRLGTEPVHPWRIRPPGPSATDLERWLVAEIRRVLDLDDVAADDDLLDLGLDSLALVELCAAIADAGYPQVDPARVLRAGTAAAIARDLGVAVAAPRSTTSVVHPAGTRVPVVALPGGGGTAVRFRFLAEALGEDQPLLIVEPAGMHRRGRPGRTVGALAGHVVAETRRHLDPGRPVAVVGYSASGPVAYETAVHLKADGRPVHLVLLDTVPAIDPTLSFRPPTGEHPVAPTVRTAGARALPRALLRSVGFRARHARRSLRRWRLERFPGRARFDVERYRAFQRTMVRAGRAYRPAPPTFGVTLLHVGEDDLVTIGRQWVPDLVEHRVGGDHGTMLEPPHVTTLASAVRDAVDAAFADPAS